ncbi:MAG TPA: hypothetical protein VMT57_08075 [Candidatus Thermoplasmatota archaeon]|nr:hypothetical protein [Candidatus Thermoplasmatota archaeon]
MEGKKKTFFTSWYFLLILITVLAIAVRSIPAWTNAAWGGDFGIYYGLTSRMIQSQQLFIPYNGWGGMYNFFPVLYVISALSHWFTGLNLLWLMPKIAPIIGGLTVFVFYFIVYEVSKRRDLALLASVLLAVFPVHVYQTSHAAPLTVGHFFMMLSIFLYLKYAQDKKYLLPLLASTVLLVMSHHLTTYFFLISVAFIVIIKSLHTDLRILRREILYVTTASALAFFYWMMVATPVFAIFMGKGAPISPPLVILCFYLLFFGALGAITLMKRYHRHIVSRIRSRVPFELAGSRRRAFIYFCLGVTVLLSAEVMFLFVNFPISGIRMKPMSIVYSIPIVLFVGFGSMGVEYLRHVENRWFFQAWFCAILTSLLYSLFTMNSTLFPDRHIEYLSIPGCVLAAAGLMYFFREKRPHVSFSLKKQVPTPYLQGVFAFVVGALVISNAVAVYPVYNSLDWMDESIPEPTVNAMQWIQENLTANTTVVATDLRLSKMLWADGINATFEDTNRTWTCSTWKECLPEFRPMHNRSHVTYVLIDDVMRDTSVNVRVVYSTYMTNESYLKFKEEPFELVYRNATVNQNGEETHWAEVYRVNWWYIALHFPLK